jgi:hypothetical protein
MVAVRMVNRVFLSSAGIIEIEVVGDQTRATVAEMGEKATYYLEQLQKSGKPIYIIDNLQRMGQTTPDARAEVARLARQLQFDACAMIGDGSVMMRYGTNLMLRAIGRRNVRYFSRREPADKWLAGLAAARLQ